MAGTSWTDCERDLWLLPAVEDLISSREPLEGENRIVGPDAVRGEEVSRLRDVVGRMGHPSIVRQWLLGVRQLEWSSRQRSSASDPIREEA